MCWSARYFGVSAKKCTGFSVDRLSYTQQSINVSRYDIINKSCSSYYIAKRHELKQVKEVTIYNNLHSIKSSLYTYFYSIV